jgi:hypothetical protein
MITTNFNAAATNFQGSLVTGQVIDKTTNLARTGLTVNAMDSSQQVAGTLGTATTDQTGRFSIALDPNQYNLQALPPLYFNVYDTDGKTLLTNTNGYVLWNNSTQEDVTIYLYTQVQAVTGTDRIGASQALNFGTFAQQSDFTGLWSHAKCSLGTTWGFIGDALVNSFSKLSLTPVSVPVQSCSVVNSDVETATRTLNDQNVAVNQVLPYNPAVNKESLTAIGGFTQILKPGQMVNLYQVNGTVKYYAVVSAPSSPPSSPPNPPSSPVASQPSSPPQAPPPPPPPSSPVASHPASPPQATQPASPPASPVASHPASPPQASQPASPPESPVASHPASPPQATQPASPPESPVASHPSSPPSSAPASPPSSFPVSPPSSAPFTGVPLQPIPSVPLAHPILSPLTEDEIHAVQQDRIVQPVAPAQQDEQIQPVQQPQPADSASLQAELADSRQAAAQKDQQIALLMQELDAIRKDQDEIKALLKAKFPS